MPPLAIKQYGASKQEDIKTIPGMAVLSFYFETQVITMTTEEDITDYFGEPIYTCTLDNAVEDGFFVDLRAINPNYAKGMFSHATRSLMDKGYIDLESNQANRSNIADLLVQAVHIVRKRSHNFTKPDNHYAGTIELPSGDEHMIFIERNETGKYTLMLPTDY